MKISLKQIALVSAVALTLAGCGSTDNAEQPTDSIKIVAAFYPLEFVASEIGGELVSVVNVTPPGVEPHDLELTPSQVASLDDADLLLFIEGFQPALEEAATQSAPQNSLEVLSIGGLNLIEANEAGHDHGAEVVEESPASEEHLSDPHVWLDPSRLIVVANAVAKKLAEIDPDNSKTYGANSIAFVAKLEALDKKFTDGLVTCERRLIVTSHAAFGYLANAYDLEQEAISGLSPDSEPTPMRLNEIGKEAKADGTTTIFFETLTSPKVAETLADELNIKTAVLDPIEGVSDGQTYFSVMESNLDALRAALACK